MQLIVSTTSNDENVRISKVLHCMLVSRQGLLPCCNWPHILSSDNFVSVDVNSHNDQLILCLASRILTTKEIDTLQFDVMLSNTPIYLGCQSLVGDTTGVSIDWAFFISRWKENMAAFHIRKVGHQLLVLYFYEPCFKCSKVYFQHVRIYNPQPCCLTTYRV